MKTEMKESEPSAVEIARAHVDAWSNYDYQTARKHLAPDVHVTVTTTQPFMAATDTTGVDKYMEGLVKFADAVDTGSARVIGSVGDEHNALLMLTVKATLGPDKARMTLPAARLYLLDAQGKIKAEQVIFYAIPEQASTPDIE